MTTEVRTKIIEALEIISENSMDATAVMLAEDALALLRAEPEPTPTYLSRDYEALYDLLLEGGEALGYVDMKWPDGDILRDPCRIRRLKPFDIVIGVRGCQYGGVVPFDRDGQNEKDLFTSECRELSLEWVAPSPDLARIKEAGEAMRKELMSAKVAYGRGSFLAYIDRALAVWDAATK